MGSDDFELICPTLLCHALNTWRQGKDLARSTGYCENDK